MGGQEARLVGGLCMQGAGTVQGLSVLEETAALTAAAAQKVRNEPCAGWHGSCMNATGAWPGARACCIDGRRLARQGRHEAALLQVDAVDLQW